MAATASPARLDQTPAGPARGWFLACAAALATAAAAATFTQVFNFDIFWHLAAGEWMLEHGQVLGTDPFSIDPDPRWVNVHWLFQVIAAWLGSLGGFGALSILKAVLAAATMLVFARALRKDVPAAWLVVCGLLCIAVIETRFRVRPEAFTILFLTVTVATVEHVRRGGRTRWLWLLPPVMLAWVNLHGLYVLGPAMFWAAALGAWLDRRVGREVAGNLASVRAFVPLAAATAACFVTPWPLDAAAQPLLLWSRISGERAAFSLGVSEFLPTWQSPYDLVLAAAIVAGAAAACLLNVRRAPIGHALWLVGFGVLAALARRNVALAGPVCGYLLALHGGAFLRRHAGRRSAALAPLAAIGAMGLAGVLTVGCATEWLFRLRGADRRSGPGLYRAHYPIDAARRLGQLDAPGGVFCENWGDAGAFIYHSRPRRVWMDGRLEAHPLERYLSQGRLQQALRTPAGADKVALHGELRFFFVRALSRDHLVALSASRRFRLLLLDDVGAVFARTDWRGGTGRRDEPLPAAPDLSRFDRPLLGSLQIDGLPVEPRRWWRQNPASSYHRPGTMFLWLAWRSPGAGVDADDLFRRRCANLAVRFLTAAAADGIADRRVAIGMLAQAHQQRALLEDATPSPAVPLDHHSACALRLYEMLDLRDLSDENTRRFAEQHVDALVRARCLDMAESAVTAMLRRLDPALPAYRTYLALRERLAQRLAVSRSRAAAIHLPQPQRALALAGPETGLAAQAIAELRAAPPTVENRLALGELLLNAGKADAAREVYDGIRLPQSAGKAAGRLLAARRAWCDRVGYRFLTDKRAMRSGPGRPGDLRTDTERYYDALWLEQLGRYAEALESLGDVVPADGQLAGLVRRLRRAAVLSAPAS